MKEDQKEVLKAWIDGEIIEYYNKSLDQWFDCSEFKDCTVVKFESTDTYRIKPKKPKNIVTTTRIERDTYSGVVLHSTYSDVVLHSTYSGDLSQHNLLLTWSPDGKTLIKAEVI